MTDEDITYIQKKFDILKQEVESMDEEINRLRATSAQRQELHELKDDISEEFGDDIEDLEYAVKSVMEAVTEVQNLLSNESNVQFHNRMLDVRLNRWMAAILKKFRK
ncbi:hypothetical protein N9N26_00695 [Candidatus Poseidoniales archaeon]|jgi:hypothetical protein|nr:hypothetical protein [Candidatus Poseidoniales archaeon]